jgi:hypothetical protein
MINTVTKKYNEDNTFNYEVVYQDGTEWSVPHDTANRHYQEILEWVAEGNIITDNGGGI